MTEHTRAMVGRPLDAPPVPVPLTTAELRDVLTRLPGLDAAVSDAERVEQLGLLESIKAAAAGAQARVAVAFDASQREDQAARGVPARERGRGIAAQVALARRESAHRGSRHLGLAKALHRELPHTQGHLASGAVSEWRATLVARETAHLDPDVRRQVDAAIAGELPTWGDARTAREVRALAQRLDPASAVNRAARAAADRRVTIRPAPDAMAVLTATLPVAQGVAAYAALTAAAEQAAATGQAGDRGRGQVMADTLVQRLTGQAAAAAVPVEIQLVMTDASLLDAGTEPAHLPGHGPIPATLARDLLRATEQPTSAGPTGAPDGVAAEAMVWVRRLYTSPDRSALVAMDSRRRLFSGSLRRFLVARDLACRTPWCDAPIRDGDHATPVRAKGATTAGNGQGLCRACNQAKEAPGWLVETTDPGPELPALPTGERSQPEGEPSPPRGDPWPPGRRHTVRVTTPTGHAYHSSAPHPPGWDPWSQQRSGSPLELHYERLLAAA